MYAIVHKRWLPCLAVLILSSPLAVAQETPAEKIRKALEQPITLNYSGNDIQDVVNHLRDKTGLNIVVDPAGVNGMIAFGVPPGIAPGNGNIDVKSEGAKLRAALKKFVQGQNLTYVVLENSLLITTEELAVTRQLTQRINVRVADVSLQKALKDITRATPMNLVLDPACSGKILEAKVSLDVENVTAETAVRLLAELGGLKSVRVDNVLFVTGAERAEKMRKEQPPVTPPPANRAWPFGNVPGPGFGIGGIGIGIAPPGAGLGVPPVQIQPEPIAPPRGPIVPAPVQPPPGPPVVR